MEELNYKRIKASGYKGYILEEAPEKILQFGEGNFLRAFVDYWFDVSNERVGWNGKAVLVQPIAQGLAEQINRQEGLYTLYLRGRENGEKVDRKRVISSVSRCLNPYEKAGYDAMMQVAESDDLEYIVSNTTEAGIVYDPACRKEDCPPASFPAKLTQVLYRRWQAGKKPVVILSCELIDNNGRSAWSSTSASGVWRRRSEPGAGAARSARRWWTGSCRGASRTRRKRRAWRRKTGTMTS